MILYLQATTNVQDLVIDYIEVKLKSGKTGSLYIFTSEAKDKLLKRLYISQSESIWKGKRKSSECGLEKMKAQSFGFRC